MAVSNFFNVLLVVILGISSSFVTGYSNLSDVTCGKGMTNSREARVVGGQDAIPREFPWLVSITRKGGHFCGGTIINSKFVLTAAHCLCSGGAKIPIAQLRVTVGEHDLKGPEVPVAKTEHIKNMIVHPKFECGRWNNDIALLELVKPVIWSESVKPACLPPYRERSQFNVFDGELAVAAGWGWLGEDKTQYKKANILQKVGVRVLEDEVCSEWYASQGKKFRVKFGQMCAGFEDGGRDTCSADSGGPLMLTSNGGNTMVIGVVSSGIGCARPRLPGVYTRVSEYVSWIADTCRGHRI